MLGFLLIGAVIVLFVVGMFYSMYLTARSDKEKRRQATKATAKIVKVGHSRNSEKYGGVFVHLTLEVEPPNGSPYEVDTEWWVKPGSTPQVEAGRTVRVKIDPRNPKVIYSGEPWFEDTNH